MPTWAVGKCDQDPGPVGLDPGEDLKYFICQPCSPSEELALLLETSRILLF